MFAYTIVILYRNLSFQEGLFTHVHAVMNRGVFSFAAAGTFLVVASK